MPSCIFCQSTETSSIHDTFGSNSRIKSNLLIFFGNQIEPFLEEDDEICFVCMEIIEEAARLKKCLLPRILRRAEFPETPKPVSIEDKWSHEDDDYYQNQRIPTPKLMHINRIEIIPEPSVTNGRISAATTHLVDEEIAECYIKSRRRRKRGNNWTRTKYSRNTEPLPDNSTATKKIKKKSNSVYLNFEYVSDGPAKDQPVSLAVQDELELENFYCIEESCRDKVDKFNSLDDLTEHIIQVHKKPDCFKCKRCSKWFTSRLHLDVHSGSHAGSYICVICFQEFNLHQDLKMHWRTHWLTAVKCNNCSKKFVNEQVLERHLRECLGDAEEFEKRAASRMDLKIGSQSDQESNHNPSFQVRILIQEGKTSIL